MSIWPLLLARYPAGEYAVMQEVSDAAGFGRSRSADGIIMSLWPSRGLELTGIECKSGRGDWLRELKNPKKAENIFRYCDRWYLVTDTEDLAKMEEIPPAWGWMCGNKNGTKMVLKKEAPKLSPQPITKDFLAAMMKRCTQGMVHKSQMEDEIERRAELRSESKNTQHKYKLEDKDRIIEELRKIINDFEKESGCRMNRWDGNNIGKAVKLVNEIGMDGIMSRLLQMRNEFSGILNRVDKSLEVLQNGVQK